MGACGGDCGIQRVREDERRMAIAVAERAHPGLVWRPLACLAPAIPFDATLALARHLEELLPMRAIARSFDASEAASIYLLAGLHAPSLIEIADWGRADVRFELRDQETYLRVALSPWARLATIQEVGSFAREADTGLEIVEEPISGVEDVRLRSAVKVLQGALRKAKYTLLDMAFLSTPLEREQTAYVEEFREPPTLWSLLFDSAPATTVRASLVQRGDA